MSGCSCLAEAKNLALQMAPAAQQQHLPNGCGHQAIGTRQIWLTRPTQTKLEVAEAKIGQESVVANGFATKQLGLADSANIFLSWDLVAANTQLLQVAPVTRIAVG